jgi:glycosyltransferase involved in cell wall biosynthesis
MSSAALKIAIISTPKSWGGGEQLAWTVGNGLAALGHSVVWVTRRESVLHQRLTTAGHDCLTICGKYPSILELVSIRKSLCEKGIQTIYGNDSQAINWTGLIGAGLRGVSKIGVKHTIFPIKSSLKYNWFLDRVLCVSNAARQVCIHGGIRRELTRTVYGGLDLSTYIREKERLQIAASLGISPQTPLYVAVGSLLQCKGLDTLIDAAAILRAKSYPFVIAICGDGALRETLQSQIDHHRLGDSVRLVGFQQDPYRWIAASDGLLHPSRSEGLSLVTIAAQLL